MAQLHIAENIVELRHKKKITQDELASFLGVTKASVSKWETKQSYPDIVLLPQIAAYFDVSMDALLGYEPQLSREQIKKVYHELACDFSEQPFDEVMKKSKQLVKEYYSCYRFLFQILVLWLNHYNLAKEEKRQEVLQDILDLCVHIEYACHDAGICNDVQAIKAMIHLQRGELDEVIEILEPLNDPMHMNMETSNCLMQAYAGKGEFAKADFHSQIAIYNDVMRLISHSMALLSLHMQETEYAEKTIQRAESILRIYEIEELHPNTASQFYYQAALYYCSAQKETLAFTYMKRFVEACDCLFDQGIHLHGDSYFYRLDEWIAESPLGAQGVRNAKLVYDTILQAMEHPLLELLMKNQDYIDLIKEVNRRRESTL